MRMAQMRIHPEDIEANRDVDAEALDRLLLTLSQLLSQALGILGQILSSRFPRHNQ